MCVKSNSSTYLFSFPNIHLINPNKSLNENQNVNGIKKTFWKCWYYHLKHYKWPYYRANWEARLPPTGSTELGLFFFLLSPSKRSPAPQPHSDGQKSISLKASRWEVLRCGAGLRAPTSSRCKCGSQGRLEKYVKIRLKRREKLNGSESMSRQLSISKPLKSTANISPSFCFSFTDSIVWECFQAATLIAYT